MKMPAMLTYEHFARSTDTMKTTPSIAGQPEM